MDIEFARTTPMKVETGSFFGAAEMVHITQSTVSMRVRPLEYQQGQPVFERGKSGAKLTPAGSQFHRHARALVRTWSQARLDVSLPVVCDMLLEFGAVSSLWHKLLIDALPMLREAQTKVLHTRASTAPANTRRDDGGKVPRRSHKPATWRRYVLEYGR